MSEFEKHIGKLKKVDLSKYDNNIEKFFEEQFRKTYTELTEQEIQDAYQVVVDYKYCGNKGPWQILFYDNFMEEKYHVVNGMVYEIIEDKALNPYDDISTLKDNGDGTFNYFITFYNGVTCLSECIEDELEKIV